MLDLLLSLSSVVSYLLQVVCHNKIIFYFPLMLLIVIHPMLQPVLILLNKQCSSLIKGWIAIPCFEVGTVYFSLKVYRSEVLLIVTVHTIFFRQFQCMFWGLFWFCFWVGKDMDPTPHPPDYLYASISGIKSCKTSNVCIPKMLPGYLKINLEHVYGLKPFQTKNLH